MSARPFQVDRQDNTSFFPALHRLKENSLSKFRININNILDLHPNVRRQLLKKITLAETVICMPYNKAANIDTFNVNKRPAVQAGVFINRPHPDNKYQQGHEENGFGITKDRFQAGFNPPSLQGSLLVRIWATSTLFIGLSWDLRLH